MLRTTRLVTSPRCVSLTCTTSESQMNAILGFANALSCMIFDARRASRRWISVTFSAKRVRKRASSTAESPPPTTAMC
ncbi:hypothetical protein D3C83_27650 [compost metagenome]